MSRWTWIRIRIRKQLEHVAERTSALTRRDLHELNQSAERLRRRHPAGVETEMQMLWQHAPWLDRIRSHHLKQQSLDAKARIGELRLSARQHVGGEIRRWRQPVQRQWIG